MVFTLCAANRCRTPRSTVSWRKTVAGEPGGEKVGVEGGGSAERESVKGARLEAVKAKRADAVVPMMF